MLTIRSSSTKTSLGSSNWLFRKGPSFGVELLSCAYLMSLRTLVNITGLGNELSLTVIDWMGSDLNDIPYAHGARFDPDKGCLPGTREQILEEITRWINSPDNDRVAPMYFLSGTAGSGKSAIAHTIAMRFDQLGRLGSSFCFNRSDHTQRRPDNLFSTISLDIADLDDQWKASLHRIIRGKRALRSTQAIRDQFKTFILEPAAALTTVGPHRRCD